MQTGPGSQHHQDPFPNGTSTREVHTVDTDISTGEGNGLPADEVIEQIAQLVARCDHLERILAHVVATVGPIQIRGSDFAAARSMELHPVHVGDPVLAHEHDEPAVFVLPEQLTINGLVTSEVKVAAVLREHADAAPEVQARAVLTALGLPVRAAAG
jgi:hypothetical protein